MLMNDSTVLTMDKLFKLQHELFAQRYDMSKPTKHMIIKKSTLEKLIVKMPIIMFDNLKAITIDDHVPSDKIIIVDTMPYPDIPPINPRD